MSEFCIMIGIMIIMYPFLVIALTAKSDKKIYSSRGYLLTLRDKRHFCARRGGVKTVIFGLMADRMYALALMRAWWHRRCGEMFM